MNRETRLMHYGRGYLPGPANPPLVRASTILHDTVFSYRETKRLREKDDTILSYGRRGTTTAHVLATAICDLEGGDGCFLFPSGVAALAGAITPFVEAGTHLLVIDTVFGPTRHYCDSILTTAGVEVSYVPWDTVDLTPYVRPNTRAIVLESPGSVTFEVPDLPKLCANAKAHNLTVIADNTYGSGWLYHPLKLGCDVSVIAGTKYLSGHADAMIGSATTKGTATAKLRTFTHLTGQTIGPDEAYACLRGMRTLGLRLARHQDNARALVAYFQTRPEVKQIFHPSLPSHPGAQNWARDACGTTGLLSVLFDEMFNADAFIDRLALFAVGSSWGGYESLAQPTAPEDSRDYPNPERMGPMVRFHAGLEHIDDLIADLESSFATLLRGTNHDNHLNKQSSVGD